MRGWTVFVEVIDEHGYHVIKGPFLFELDEAHEAAARAFSIQYEDKAVLLNRAFVSPSHDLQVFRPLKLPTHEAVPA